MQDTLLSLQHISKNFGEGDVLRDISLDVARGEFVTLLGASGCGKTTTLRIISGLETPDEGTVLLDGRDVTALPPERRPVNTVFQSYALFPHMNVEKNVAYGLRVRRMDKASIEKRVREMLELVQMADFAKRMPSQLSGGQRQRIAIARALASRPELLCCDEPVSALDVAVQAQILNLLRRLQDDLGLSYLFISHDLGVIQYICDDIAVLYLGQIVETGTSESLFANPLHPYTRALLAAVPSADPRRRQEPEALPSGPAASPVDPPPGCRFAPLCPCALDICRCVTPPLVEAAPRKRVACHRHTETGGSR